MSWCSGTGKGFNQVGCSNYPTLCRQCADEITKDAVEKVEAKWLDRYEKLEIKLKSAEKKLGAMVSKRSIEVIK